MAKHNIQATILLTTLALFTLSACEGGKLEVPRKTRTGEIGVQYEDNPRDTLFGEGGLTFGDEKQRGGAQGGGGLGVNTYLWRASLDTIAFMPVTSADPFGGVIITDWYSPPETPNERFKLNLIIRDRALRADGIHISIFRQILDRNANWRDAAVEPDAGRKLEDAVLTRARQLRNETRMMQN